MNFKPGDKIKGAEKHNEKYTGRIEAVDGKFYTILWIDPHPADKLPPKLYRADTIDEFYKEQNEQN